MSDNKKKPATADIYRQVKESFCVVKKFESNGNLCGLWIEFAGEAANIPSTSNSRAVRYRRLKGGSRVVPFIGKKSEHIATLTLMSKLYFLACIEAGHGPVNFGAERVSVTVHLAVRPGRWDSHNMAKPVGDWLEEVEIIDDDSRAEIHCYKKADYPAMTMAPATTQIIIQPHAQIHGLVERHLYEAGQASTGYKFIG